MPYIITQGLTVPAKAQTSGNNAGIPGGFLNELVLSKVVPDYYTLLKLGVVYYTIATGINPTGFTGGAGGTPIVGLMNPAGSGKDVVTLATRIGVRTTGTAAANLDFAWYAGVSVLPTGTVTVPTNAYSQQKSGSVVQAFVNTAMTSSTAITLAFPSVSVGQTIATTPTATVPTDSGTNMLGLLTAQPGILLALGAPATLTAAAIDVAVYWAELPA